MKPGEAVLESVEAQVDPSHSALIIVDVQNDFLHPNGFIATRNIDGYLDMSMVPGMAAQTKRLLAAAREAGVLTVFIQMIGGNMHQSPPAIAHRRRMHRTATGQTERGDQDGSCREGTWGADFFEGIRPDGREREVVVKKHRYSAFWGTDLDQVLRSNGIKTMVMCGDATSGCVESTARDGFMNDYYVVAVRDACADFDRDRHEYALRKLDLSFGYVVPTDQVLDAWNRAGNADTAWEASEGRAA